MLEIDFFLFFIVNDHVFDVRRVSEFWLVGFACFSFVSIFQSCIYAYFISGR